MGQNLMGQGNPPLQHEPRTIVGSKHLAGNLDLLIGR